MTKTQWIFLVGLLMLCVNSSFASANEESDRAALREIKKAYETAVNEGKPSDLAPYLSESVTAVMVTDEEVTGLAGLEAYWRKIQDLIGKGGTYKVQVQVDKTDLFGDLAISRGTTTELVHLASGKDFHYSARWTTVCRRENGAWKLLRMHSSMDPIQNEFVKASKSAGQWIWGGTGLAIGAIGAAAGLWILKKRSS